MSVAGARTLDSHGSPACSCLLDDEATWNELEIPCLSSVSRRRASRWCPAARRELLITRLLGRDKDQKVWCVAKNKWGTVQSKQVILRVPGSVQQAQPSPAITAALERSAGSTLNTARAPAPEFDLGPTERLRTNC